MRTIFRRIGVLALACGIPCFGQNYIIGGDTGAEHRIDDTGESFQYTINVTGSGTYDLSSGVFFMKAGTSTIGSVTLTIQDSLGETIASATLNASDFCSQTSANCQSYGFRTFTFAPAAVLIGGSSYTAILGSTDADPQQDSAYFLKTGAPTTFTVAAGGSTGTAPALTISKSVSPDPLVAGGSATYIVTVTNVGNAGTAGAILVADTLPNGLTYVSASGTGWTCSYSARVVSCATSATLAPAAASQISIHVNVNDNAAATLTNTVSVSGGGAQPTGNESFSLTASVTGATQSTPSLTISKSVTPDPLVAGATATYLVTVTNMGSAATSGMLSFTDSLPSGLTYADASGANWTCSYSAPVVHCTTSEILAAGGTSQITIHVDVNGDAPPMLTNSVTVSGGGALADSTFNLTTSVVGSVQPAPELTVSKSVSPDPLVAGASAMYMVTVTNVGNASTAGAILVADTLPSGLTYVSASGTGWTCSYSAPVVSCATTSTLAAGADSRLLINVNVNDNAVAPLTNFVSVSGGGGPASAGSTTVTTGVVTLPPLGTPPTSSGLQIPSYQLPDGSVGISYFAHIAVTGGTPPYIFSATPVGLSQTVSQPPPGLILSSTFGTITGIPAATGAYLFAIEVTDSVGAQASQTYTVTISPALTFMSSVLPDGVAGTPYSAMLVATGGTPPYRYSAVGALPQRLSLSSSGVLAGTPSSVGTFRFTAQVTDSKEITAKRQYALTFTAAPPLLRSSRQTLTFTAVEGGERPDPQGVAVFSSDPSQSQYTVQADSGMPGTAAPAWLSFSPSQGVTPTFLAIRADPKDLIASTYNARILVSVQGDPTQNSLEIGVVLNLKSSTTPPELEASAKIVKFRTTIESPGIQKQTIFLRNIGGGGALPFTISTEKQSPWLNFSADAMQTERNSPVAVQVQVDSTGLSVGHHRDVILIRSAGGNVSIPVVLFVSDQGPLLSLGVTGVRFRIRQGNGTSRSRTVRIFNDGDPSTIIHWSAKLLSGSDWLELNPASGTAGMGTPGTLTLTPSDAVAGLDTGVRYALVSVTDPDALDSPQYLTAVLDIRPGADAPIPDLDVDSAGAVFTAAAGQTGVLSQTFPVRVSSKTPVQFATSASATDGGTWLTVSPQSGDTSTMNPGPITISVSASGLAPGTYTGEVNVAIGSNLASLGVTFVVTGAATPASGGVSTIQHQEAAAKDASAACLPSRLSVTQTGLANNFSVPAGWPTTLIAQLNDDCGAKVANGSMVASFSNGDPPLRLAPESGSAGTYSATWQPANAVPGMTVTVRATAGSLGVTTAYLTGDVATNTVATLNPDGIASNLNPQLGGGLSPGIVSAIYGTGLAAASESTSQVPLVTAYKGTQVLVGGYEAPLYYVSPDQLNAQIPFELAPNRQYAIVASANGALTLPETIDLVPVQPGVAAFADGTLIAQHTDFQLVDEGHPAKRGEYLIMYLVGLGATDPSVASGASSPSDPFARPVVAPTVTVDGENADIYFAGLTPGGVGLFQIDFKVPNDAKLGTPLDVVVMQGDVTANVTQLVVAE